MDLNFIMLAYPDDVDGSRMNKNNPSNNLVIFQDQNNYIRDRNESPYHHKSERGHGKLICR